MRSKDVVQPAGGIDCGAGALCWWHCLWLLQKPALVQASVDASGFRENSDGRSAVPKGRAFTMVPFAVVTF